MIWQGGDGHLLGTQLQEAVREKKKKQQRSKLEKTVLLQRDCAGTESGPAAQVQAEGSVVGSQGGPSVRGSVAPHQKQGLRMHREQLFLPTAGLRVPKPQVRRGSEEGSLTRTVTLRFFQKPLKEAGS